LLLVLLLIQILLLLLLSVSVVVELHAIISASHLIEMLSWRGYLITMLLLGVMIVEGSS
jgi:hypothetical protein